MGSVIEIVREIREMNKTVPVLVHANAGLKQTSMISAPALNFIIFIL